MKSKKYNISIEEIGANTLKNPVIGFGCPPTLDGHGDCYDKCVAGESECNFYCQNACLPDPGIFQSNFDTQFLVVEHRLLST